MRYLLDEGELGEGKLNAKVVRELLDREAALPASTGIAVAQVDLASFDVLLSASGEPGSH